MLKETHLRLLRNLTVFADYQAAVASFETTEAKEIQNADGTPRLARYYTNGEGSAVKTILGVFHADTKTYTLFDADSETSAQMQKEIDLIEKALGLDEEGNYIPYEEGRYTNTVSSMTDAVEALDDALSNVEDKTDALAIDKADKVDLVWTKDAETSIARNTKNQKVAEIKDNGELWLYVEGEYMNINDLLGQLAHEEYDVTVAPEEGVKNVTDPTAEELDANTDKLNVSGTLSGAVVNNKVAMKAGSINMNLVDYNDAHADVVADGNVEITDLATSGALARSVSNAGMSINNGGDVVINGGDWGQSGYNAIEVGLAANALPKNITIENVNFTADMSNNAILVFATQNDATITVKDCHFANVSNVLRLSNRTNATGVTVNIENCVVDHWDSDPNWAGFLILEDYLPYNKQEGDVAAANVFGKDKITVNFKNLVHNGKKVMPAQGKLDSVLGTRDAETQVAYIWNNYEKGTTSDFVPYNEETIERWPTFNFE